MAMLEQGWSCAEFISEFGKNYLDRDELRKVEELREPVTVTSGFYITDDGNLPY